VRRIADGDTELGRAVRVAEIPNVGNSDQAQV
jgi:hypothetical protein